MKGCVAHLDISAVLQLQSSVSILTTNDGKGGCQGCVVTSAVPLTDKPVRIGVCLSNDNKTYEALCVSKTFQLNICGPNLPIDVLTLFGTRSGRELDKFQGLPVQLTHDINNNPQLMEYMAANLICWVVDSVTIGSHTFFIALVDDTVLPEVQIRPMTVLDLYEQGELRAPRHAPIYQK